MDWTWTALYAGLALMALLFVWNSPYRPIGWALVGNVAFTALAMATIVPAEGEGAVNTIAELFVVAASLRVLIRCPLMARILLVFALMSCMFSFAYSLRADVNAIVPYEELVNITFALQCFVLIYTGLWSVVGSRVASFWRWRRHRRRAAHAGRRWVGAGLRAPGRARALMREDVPPSR